MKVAVVHDWLNGMRGGEYVLEAILELYPEAEVFTLLHQKGTVSPLIESHPIHTSLLQQIPLGIKKYRYFLPIMPALIQRFDLSAFDLILSSSHCVAKGVIKGPRARHLSYLHAPMRYVWDRYEDYFGPDRAGWLVRKIARIFRAYLQNWDRKTAQPIDRLLCNSRFVAGQIRAHYGREAQVVYPFCDPGRFDRPRSPGPHFLMVGAFAPNKRVELAIEACNRLRLPLRIVGSGQEEKKLRAMAGSTIEFLGVRTNAEIAQEYARCRAFLFPGIEDFGITPIEAMAAGAPVIAFRAGGALETVTDDTGIFFDEPTVESLMQALQNFANRSWDESKIRSRGRAFTKKRFQMEFQAEVQNTV